MNDGIIAGNKGDIAALRGGVGGYHEINGGYISGNVTNHKYAADDEYFRYENMISHSLYDDTKEGYARNEVGFIVLVPYYYRLSLDSFFTPLHLNGGSITDNSAETVVAAPSVYAGGINISHNTYNPEYKEGYEEHESHEYKTNSASALNALYLNVPEAKAENDVLFEITYNSGFGSAVNVEDCTVINNTAEIAGGGAANLFSETPLAFNLSRLDENTAPAGAGFAAVLASGENKFSNSTINKNKTTEGVKPGDMTAPVGYQPEVGGGGGGILALTSDVTLGGEEDKSPVEVSGNSAVNGGGIYSAITGVDRNIEINNAKISANTASGSGGGMYITGSGTNSDTIGSKSEISGNTAEEYGGGVHITAWRDIVGRLDLKGGR